MSLSLPSIAVVVGCVCYCLLLSRMVHCFGYFEKDHKLDTPFPPPFRKSHIPDIPTGHLRSLGYQRISDGPVTEKSNSTDGKEFFEHHASKNNPVTIRRCLHPDSPLMNMWTDDKLRYRHGALNISVIRRHRMEPAKPKYMLLSEFLNNYKLMDLYMTTTLPAELESEVWLPDFLRCGPQGRSFVEAELWMGYGGTGSLLHYHGHHQVHCAVDGREDLIFIHPDYKVKLHCEEKDHQAKEGYSTLNTEMINMFKEKHIADIPWTYTSLKPGDCTFVPAGYLHQVRHLGRSLSFSLQFEPTLDANVSDCPANENAQKTLMDFPMIWTMKRNAIQLKNEKLSPEDLRKILILLMQKDEALTFERFRNFYTMAMEKFQDSASKVSVKSVFANLDVKQRGKITRAQVLSLDDKALEKVCRILNNVHLRKRDEL